jgi:hypothetical protein
LLDDPNHSSSRKSSKKGKHLGRTIQRLVGRPCLLILLILHLGEATKWENWWQDNSKITGTTLPDDTAHSSSRISSKKVSMQAGQFID